MTDTHAEHAPAHDEKGRPSPEIMSERDMLAEIVTHMRQIADTVDELSDSPMVRALQNGSNPLMAMIGRG